MCMSTRNGNVFLKFRSLQYTEDREKWKGTGVEMEENANLKLHKEVWSIGRRTDMKKRVD